MWSWWWVLTESWLADRPLGADNKGRLVGHGLGQLSGPGAVWCCQRCGDASNASAGAELDGTGALFMMQGRRRFREEEMMEIVKQGVNLTGNGMVGRASLLYFDNGALAV